MSRSKAEVDNFVASFRRKAKSEQEIQLRGYQFATFYWEAREYALGIKWAQTYLAVKHSDSRAHKLLGNLYEAVKDYGKAIDSYKKSLEFNETQKELMLRIASLGCTIQNYDVEKLRYWVERAERFYPGHINIHKIKENIFRRSGKLPDYEIYLRKKLVQRKGDYYLNCKLVKLLIEMHRLREAVDHILLTQDLESVADQPIWWESTVHTLEIYIKSIRQGEEKTANEETIMEMHSHLLVALSKWILLSLAMMDKPPHNAVILLKGLDQCLLRANSLKTNSNWDSILDEMSAHLYYLIGLHLCRMAAMGSFRWADILGFVTSCFAQSAQVKLPDMSGRPEYQSKKWKLLASARLSEVFHMLHAFKKQYGPDWLEKCQRSTANLQSQTHLFHVVFGQEADPNKSFFMSDTNFAQLQGVILDDLVGVVLKYDQDAVMAQPHNLQLLVWLGLQWDVRTDGISPDLGTFIEKSFDKLHFSSNNLKITSVDNLRLLDIEAFLYILVKSAKTKRDTLLAEGRTSPDQPSVLPVALCQMLYTEEQEKWFKAVCALYTGNAKSEERARIRLAIQKGLEAIRNSHQFNIDTPLLIHLAKTFRTRMLEEKKENDVPGNEQFLACQRLSVHYWQAASEHLKLLASDKALAPPKHAFFVASQGKIKKEEIFYFQEEAAIALSEYEFQQGHHQQALNLLSKVKGVTGLFTKALMCKQLSQMEVDGKEDSQITANMILAQGTYLDQCTYALYSAMDAIQDDHNSSMHEEIQQLLEEVDTEKQQLARKGLEETKTFDTSRRISNSTPMNRRSLGKTPGSARTSSVAGRETLPSIGDISTFHQGLSPDPSPQRLMSELRTMNVSQTRLIDENSQLRTLALSHSRLLEQNSEILSKHNEVMDQNKFLMEQILHLNKELQELKLNSSISSPNQAKEKDTSTINTDQTIIINAADCRIEHADAPNLTIPQPPMYYPPHTPMFPPQLIPSYLPGIPMPGLAEQQYIPSMMSSTPGPHYQGEEAYEAVFSTPTRNIAQSRTPETTIPSESTRIDEGFARFSGLIQPNTFLQQNPSTGMPQVAPNGSAGMKPSIFQQPKLNIPQPASSPVAMGKGETAPERSASDAPLLRQILIGSEVDRSPAVTQSFPAFSSISSNSRFGGGDRLSEKSAVSPNFTFGTRLESAKAKEAEHTPVFTPSASFGSKSDASGKPQTVTSGFSFGGSNMFTPVSTNPATTSSIQFSQTSSIFNQPAAQPTSQLVAATGFKGLNVNSTKEPTSTSPFAGLSLGAQTPPTAAPQPRKPTEGSLFSGQESAVSSSTSKSREEDDVIYVYERKPTPAQIAMALKLKLPPTFYLYEYKEPCPGCIGCEDIDLAMLYKKENKVFKDATQASTTILQDPKPTQESTSTEPLMFGGGSSTSLTFASVTAGDQNTPDFMKQQSAKAFSWTSAGVQLFSSGAGGDDEYDPHYEAIVTLPEVVDLKTGEEDENCLYKDRAKLYRFNKDINQWKERGVGDVKFMQNKNTGRIRILMRRDQVLKVCANHMITADLDMKAMQSSDRAWVWSALDFSEGEAKMEQLAIKFKKPEMAKEFKEKFDECKVLVKEAETKANEKPETKKTPEKPKETFADKFKPKPGTWTCDTCLVNNPPDTVKCLACATLKPGAVPPQSAAASTKPSGATGFRFDGPTSSPQTSKFSFGGGSGPVSDVKSQSGFSFGKPADVADSKPSEFSFGKSTGGAAALPSTGFSFGQASGTPTSGFSFGKTDDGNKADSTTSKPSGFSFGQTSDNSRQPPTGGFSFVADSSKTAYPVQPKAAPAVTTDVTAEKSMTLAERLKPKPGSWSCPTCYCQNSAEQKKCPACQTCQPGSQPEASSSTAPSSSSFQFGSSSAFGQLQGSSQEGAVAPTSPTKTFSFGSSGKVLPQFSFGEGGETTGATSKPVSTGFTFGATPASSGFIFGNNQNQNASEEQALDLSSPKKTGSPSCKFSEIPKSFTFQFKMDPHEAANAPPASPTKSPGIQRSPGLIKSPGLDKSGDDSYYKDDDNDGLHFEPVVQLDLVELTTGEEDEEAEFCHRAKMYRYNKETNEWKERGLGDIKILRHKVTGLYRLLMRREQVLKLCANHFILPEIVVRPNSGSDRSWVWTAMDASDDGQVKSELLAVRFKTAETATEFKEAFENAKEAVKKIKTSKKSEPAEEVKERQEINKDEVKKIENEEGTEDQKRDEVEDDEEYEDDDDYEDYDDEDDDDDDGEDDNDDEDVEEEEKPKESQEEKQLEKQEEKQEEKPGNTEDNTAAAAPPKLTFSFGMDFASAVRKTMSEDKDKPSSIFSPEKNSGSSPNKSSDQGFYPEEERDDLQFKPVVTLQEVEVKTGEEEEEQLFCQRAKLFRWNRDESQWKDRGVGEIKILKHNVLNRCRILMRRDQVLKICANHIITPEMELKPNAGSDRSLVWNAMDASEMEPQLEQLAVRFKTSDITSEFKSVFEKCQKSPTN